MSSTRAVLIMCACPRKHSVGQRQRGPGIGQELFDLGPQAGELVLGILFPGDRAMIDRCLWDFGPGHHDGRSHRQGDQRGNSTAGDPDRTSVSGQLPDPSGQVGGHSRSGTGGAVGLPQQFLYAVVAHLFIPQSAPPTVLSIVPEPGAGGPGRYSERS